MAKDSSRKPKVVVDEKNMTVKVGSKKFELKTMKNGSLYYMKPYKTADGKTGARPRIVSGSSQEYMAKIRRRSASTRKSRASRKSSAQRRRSLEKRNAAGMRAFLRHYSKSRYETEKGRKIAMSRDLRNDNQESTRSLSKYRSDPSKYDMAGVDMGNTKTVADLKKKIRKSEKKE